MKTGIIGVFVETKRKPDGQRMKVEYPKFEIR